MNFESDLRKHVLIQMQNDKKYIEKYVSSNASDDFMGNKSLNELLIVKY